MEIKRESVIITINRQVGSGGFAIAQQLAEKLSAVYVDKKILTKAAAELDEAEEAARAEQKSGTGKLRRPLDEKKKRAFWERFAGIPISSDLEHYRPDMKGMTTDQEVHEKEKEMIEKLVGNGPAVILGRGGFFRMQDRQGHISVFINAPREYRLANIQRIYGLSEDDALELMKKTNEARARYTYKVTGKDVLDVRNYDLSVDSSKLGEHAVVDFILDYAKLRFRESGSQFF